VRRRIATAFLVVLAAAMGLAGCQPPRTPATAPPPDPDTAAWPPYDYGAAAAGGEAVFRLDPARSRVEVLVGKSGPLARFGHEHVIAVDGLEGWLALGQPLATARADLRFPVAALQVDPAEARQRHGLDDPMTPDDIQGTRENLMRHVLEPDRWPMAELSLRDFARVGGRYSARLNVAFNGGRHSMALPFDLRVADDAVTVQGRFTLDHGDLGLEPYSALGGSLSVAETLEIEFDLRGEKAPARR
jgi:hypothetical protein